MMTIKGMVTLGAGNEEEEDVAADSEKEEEEHLSALEQRRLEGKKPQVVAGTVKMEDKQWLAQEEEKSEAKCLAIAMMRK